MLMNNAIKSICFFLLFSLFLGCTIAGEQRKHWDLQSSKEDMELTVKKHTAIDAIERQNAEDSLNDLNYKWHIDLVNRIEEVPQNWKNDKEREKAINLLIDKQLHEGSNNNK